MPNLLDAAYHAVHDYPGGASSLAPRMGKSSTTLCHEVTGTGTAKLGLLDAKKITDLTGDLSILQAWAMDAGQMLVPLPSLDAQQGDDCMQRLATTAREFGDLVAEVSGDLSDGTVSDNELGRIERECGELVVALHGLMAAITQRNQASKPPVALRRAS